MNNKIYPIDVCFSLLFSNFFNKLFNFNLFLFKKDTPNTELADFAPDIFDEFSLRPDLSIMCKLCKLYIELSELKDHSDYHGALSYFGLTSLPSTEDQLIEKRKSLLKTAMSRHIKKARDLNTNKAIEWNTKVKQINDAYELLKSYMTNTFELNRQLRKKNVKLDAQGFKFNFRSTV